MSSIATILPLLCATQHKGGMSLVFLYIFEILVTDIEGKRTVYASGDGGCWVGREGDRAIIVMR